MNNTPFFVSEEIIDFLISSGITKISSSIPLAIDCNLSINQENNKTSEK